MAVGLTAPAPLNAVSGVRWGTAATGIKYSGRQDLALMEISPGANCAAVYTRNAFCAAPVIVARRHGDMASPRYLLINSGNANAGTGDEGLRVSEASCSAVAQLGGCDERQVLPFSTGVIGEPLPLQRIEEALPQAFSELQAEGWNRAAEAIMTTDTLAKGVSRQITLGGELVTITGICKGSGMICPDMATLLAFIATDASVETALLQRTLKRAVDNSFNAITVDGDTSTNDACVVIATGKSAAPALNSDQEVSYVTFAAAVTEVCQLLAQAVIRDAEGATKFITITVSGGADEAECRQVADAVAHSPLVKTALFASDPNWGRILAAVGRAGLVELDIDKVEIHLNGLSIVQNGERDAQYTEAAGLQAMSVEEITIAIQLGRGSAEKSLWTCDLSYDYVKINAEYRT